MDDLIHEWRGNALPPYLAAAAVQDPSIAVWQALEGSAWRIYAPNPPALALGWQRLQKLRCIDGASAGAGAPAPIHYVVEADVSASNEEEFNAWYETEHLPGLARVPGAIRAQRWRRLEGTPRYVACYDLLSIQTVEHPAWLAVRHTPWSDRVRKMFLNTQRTMFRRAAPPP
ncbi:MAG: hypothetical protein WBC18_17820 [Ottowia sp.]|uniref:hypothetical protein n=1 Tax=Ottowia sp. TaxID=1898956 RepID=UPI003C7383FE